MTPVSAIAIDPALIAAACDLGWDILPIGSIGGSQDIRGLYVSAVSLEDAIRTTREWLSSGEPWPSDAADWCGEIRSLGRMQDGARTELSLKILLRSSDVEALSRHACGASPRPVTKTPSRIRCAHI